MEKINKIDEAVIGKYCVVRGAEFGVFAGTVEAVEGNRALLRDARRMWYWDGAASISQIALEGVKVPEKCKFTVTVDSVLLSNVIEIIPCTAAAEANIKEVPVWKR